MLESCLRNLILITQTVSDNHSVDRARKRILIIITTLELLVRARLAGIGGAKSFSGKFSGISVRWFRSRFCPVTLLRSPSPTIVEAFSN